MSNLPPDSLSYSDLGGTKLEYTAPIDTSTDRSADEVNLAFAAVSAMSRTSPRAWVKFSVSGAGALTLVDWDAVWKAGTVTPPVLTLVTTGKITITLPATVLDEQGAEHSLNLKAGFASIEASTDTFSGVIYCLETKILTANTVRLWVASSTLAYTPINTTISLLLF